MSGSNSNRRRRRRRRHSSAVVRTPEQLNQRRRRPVNTAQALACAAFGVICLALITLIWINTGRAIREQNEDLRGRVEAALNAQASTLATQAQHELQMIDQSLAILQAAWDANPNGFSLAEWRKNMPGLTAVADDLFIANADHVIVQDVVPAAVGQGIGSAYANFANGSLEPLHLDDTSGRDNTMLIGDLGTSAVIRQYLMYLVRPLAKPAGWLIGASYRSSALTTVFANAGLGHGGLAALIDTHRGGVQALAGTAAVRPVLSLVNTPMFTAMTARPDGGIWVGNTPIDNVDRIIAFRRVPGRDLMVLVGVATADAMAPADSWAEAADTLAFLATLLLLAIAVTVLWEIWHWRRIRHRQRALAQTQALLSGVQTELAALRMRAAVSDAQMQALLGTAAAGVAMIDAHDRLTNWNTRFADLSQVPGELLREGLPLDELLRQQVLLLPSLTPEQIEAEVTRRLALLRPGAGGGEVVETAPGDARLVLRSQPTPDGGLLLILHSAAPLPTPEARADVAAEADPVEW